jgi:Domain of unknown function (DUF222)
VLELENLEAAAAELEANADLDFVDPSRLSAVVNRLQGVLSRVVHRATSRGEQLLTGQSSCSWVAARCQMSKTAASDRLCVGKQLEQLPRVAQALSAGEIGYQAASIVCHLQERIAEVGCRVDEEEWVGMARQWSLKALSAEAASTWHGLDPAGFNLKVEEAHERRQLFLSPCGDMLRVDGWLEVSAGAVLKRAIEALAAPLGSDDKRSPRQRRADAAVEMAQHVLDQGQLRRRHGVRPHIAIHTTLAGLKGELGAPASQLEDGTPISSQTVQRLACDGLLHRVLKADSMVIDVGRAKRTAQPAQWRGLKARHKTCAWTECDRPIGWTQAHHLDFWMRGGKTDLPKMIPLCHHHHRLVHEGGWQVVQTSQRLEFIPPDRPALTRRRWGESRWAA